MKREITASVIVIALFALAIVLFTSCTQNERAKLYGGTARYEIPSDQQLVTITWKGENSLWILTKNRQDTVYNTYTFQEQSSFGLIEGTVIIKELR